MAHGTVCRQDQRYMIWVQAGIVIRGVTTFAGIGRIVVVPMVAGVAIVGNGNVGASKWVNRVMVKSRGHPSCFGMAECTICWKLHQGVVWVACSVIIGLMATHAGIRGVVVVPVVAYRTVVCNRYVSAI